VSSSQFERSWSIKLKTYKYLDIDINPHYPWLNSTDSQTLEWLIKELVKESPKSRVGKKETLPNGDLYRIRIDGGSAHSVAFLIIKLLTEHGWEPFAYSGDFLGMRQSIEQ